MNLSLDNATVPMKLKEAALTPIINKESLDHELYPSFNIGPFLIPDLNPNYADFKCNSVYDMERIMGNDMLGEGEG